MTYSQIMDREERPTVRAPAPEPTEQELKERLENTERQIAILMARRERILQKLNPNLQRDRNLAEILHK